MAGRSLLVCFIDFLPLRSPRCGRKKTSWKAKYKHGLIYYNTKKIYVSDYTATVHEFGHFLDKLLNFPAKHEVVFHIEAQAAASVLGDYAKANSREYFAEYFSF